jgi:hypothetical protein
MAGPGLAQALALGRPQPGYTSPSRGHWQLGQEQAQQGQPSCRLVKGQATIALATSSLG